MSVRYQLVETFASGLDAVQRAALAAFFHELLVLLADAPVRTALGNTRDSGPASVAGIGGFSFTFSRRPTIWGPYWTGLFTRGNQRFELAGFLPSD